MSNIRVTYEYIRLNMVICRLYTNTLVTYECIGAIKMKCTIFLFTLTLDTNLRVFQYKLLNLIIFTNDKLFKFQLEDSPSCTFCKTNEESLEHLLFFCKIIEFFWKEVLSWLAILINEIVDFSLIDVLFGKFDIDEDFIVINHILLLAKFYI